MLRYIIRRLLQGVLTFFGATFVVYALMFANQDDPLQALAGEKPLADNVRQALTERYHLDEPFIVQYGYYMKNLISGDFGKTLLNRDIKDLLLQSWPITAQLALMAVVFAALIGITAGVVAGIRRTGIFDSVTLIITLVLISIPIVVLAPMGQLFFGVEWGLFPPTAGAKPSFYALILPAMVLGVGSLATYSRLTRTSVVENLRADYVRTAKAKGLTRNRVIGV
uniref:ABC transporter permease n=1 Tax=Catenuloplanes japonicus TaxID=33876 RepID=UPI0005273753